MHFKVNIFVGGLGTSRNYFEPFIQRHGPADTNIVYCVTNKSLDEQASKVHSLVQKYTESPEFYRVRIYAFSLGCMIVMKLLEREDCNEVVGVCFVNPCNIELDYKTRRYEKWYRVLWALPLWMKELYLFWYERFVRTSLEEPRGLMRGLLSRPFKYWCDIVEKVCQTSSWVRLIKKSVYRRRITVIGGDRDRYIKFSELLANHYSNHFHLKIVEGQHHIMQTL